MKKVEFLIKRKLDNLSKNDLIDLMKEYFNFLIKNPFPKAPSDNSSFYDMILLLKRKDENNPISIGPYRNISPFEAANRIASDLVIIIGLLQLIENEKMIDPILNLRLGTTHVKNIGDFTIKIGNEVLEGEAFNVAPSFLKNKLSKTLSKWKEKKLIYILINEDAFENLNFQNLDKRIFKVINWNKPLEYNNS